MRSRMFLAPAVAAVAAAAATGLTTGTAAAAGGPQLLPGLDSLTLRSDCGPTGQDLGKAFHLSGPIPIEHSGCTGSDGQTLRIVPEI